MPEPKATKRRKPKSQRKESTIPIRCSEEHKKILQAKAAKVGLGVSSWLVQLGLKATE